MFGKRYLEGTEGGLQLPHTIIQFQLHKSLSRFPGNKYMCKVNLRSQLTIKATERRQWHRSHIFIVNFEHALCIYLVFLLFFCCLWTSKCLLHFSNYLHISIAILQSQIRINYFQLNSHTWCFAWFGAICAILQKQKATTEECYF